MTTETPEEVVEAARRLLNDRVEELQRNNGVNRRYDLTVGAAIDMIRILDRKSRPRPGFGPTRRKVMVPGDREVIGKARWHPASKLLVYLDSRSWEYRRDAYHDGVYVLVELTANGEVPRFVEAIPRYVGKSIVLSSRLRTHASGGFASNPANHVLQEYLLEYASEKERAAYAVASREEQQEIRRLCMSRRDLWVRTAHTLNEPDSDRLEHALIRQYEEQGYELWNKIKYSTGT